MARATGGPRAGSEAIEAIESVATALFIRDGYRGVSYLDIGRELGITHSNIHYYYRTKSALAEAVLRRVARETLQATGVIWADPACSLVDKFVRVRDWTYAAYLRFNPGGRGGRPWGLLWRFSLEADALTPEMRQMIRTTLKRLEDDIRDAVCVAVRRGELTGDAPIDGVVLQISSVMAQTGQLTRHAGGFSRLDDLLRFTITTLLRAYAPARVAASPVHWPAPVWVARGRARSTTRASGGVSLSPARRVRPGPRTLQEETV